MKWQVKLEGQDGLLKAFNIFDRAKPAMITKALKGGCVPLRNKIKDNVRAVTSGGGKTKIRTKIEAYSAGREALNLDIFQKIRDEEEARWNKKIGHLEAEHGTSAAAVNSARKKMQAAMKKLTDKALVGKAWRKFKKLPGVAMMEAGKTGMLYKSIDIKYLRPPVAAYHRTTGELMGYTGQKGRTYEYSREDWALAKWRPLKGATRTAYVGPAHMVLVAYNPFSRELVRVDPARYAHLVEKGHLIKIRGKVVGKTGPRRFIQNAELVMRHRVLSEMRRILKDEVGRTLGGKGAI